MDNIDPILFVASIIYDLVEKVQANKKQCHRVRERVKALQHVVESIKTQKKGQSSAEVERTLRELSTTLASAKDLIEKFTKSNWMKRVLKSGNHQDEFQSLNDRLNDAFQVLSLNLAVEQKEILLKVFDQTSRDKEDEMDRKQDNTELEKLLREHHKEMLEELEALKKKVESIGVNVEKVVEILKKPSITEEAIRMIKPDELTYTDFPKVAFIKTETSEVYKGTYRNFPVAIKRYIETLNTSIRSVEKIFKKEVETMKRFESPNILRMFGISVDKQGPNPQCLLIMEYCELGNLRQVLDDEKLTLSWTTKARMCRDAARGLYRLHHTEDQSKVHGSINSSKFLVSEGYVVKLGGFELAKTETSLKRTTKANAHGSLAYFSPQMLLNINHKYSKACEIYSFGIVMWEVVTRSKPYEGWSNKDFLEKVGKQKYRQPLPDDCPKPLGNLINACRAHDHFQRPSAGELVDKLQTVLGKIEE
ncbi:mixed lineage kinase domain-like protein isoform X2 [Sander lucioperca]|uniref:mixed lineage kinase domain-like protein isoform X2 n=1 Tax=Sander lucioperca TaxID=283035 RepID=UPI001653DBF5|nr:mixed lineage kinase domain-like protein isoform X2 [Sander lucioperca]